MIQSSHYSLQKLELYLVLMTSDNVPHLAHYINIASELKELELRDVCDRAGRYVYKSEL